MSIADTLNAAKAAAATTPAQTGTAVAEVAPAAGRRLTLGDVQNNAGSSVATYLKVGTYGLTIGKDVSKLIKEFEATIDLSDTKTFWQTRYGNPAQYYRSYDGAITAGTNKPWTQTLAQAKQMDPTKASDPFTTTELVIVPTSDVKSSDGKDVVAAGTRIGYTPPYTGVAELTKLLKAVTEAGGDIEKSKVVVTVGFEALSRNGNNWGVVTYTFKKLAE